MYAKHDGRLVVGVKRKRTGVGWILMIWKSLGTARIGDGLVVSA